MDNKVSCKKLKKPMNLFSSVYKKLIEFYYLISINSTSKISAAPPGISFPAPEFP